MSTTINESIPEFSNCSFENHRVLEGLAGHDVTRLDASDSNAGCTASCAADIAARCGVPNGKGPGKTTQKIPTTKQNGKRH